MKILEKRPLALILCIMLGGFSFSSYLSTEFKIAAACAPLLTIGVILVFYKLNKGRNAFVIISLAAISASVFLSLIWSITFFPTEYYDDSVSLNARIYDIDNSSSSTSKIICKSEKINGKRDKHTFIIYLSKDEGVKLRKYDLITFDATISEFSNYDDGFDGRSYYISEGYSALLTDATDISVNGNEVDVFDCFFKSLRIKISNKLKLRTDFETGSFLSALIVGDRNDLSGNTKLNFARLGISHILALSGMHLAILSYALNLLLTCVGVRKKIRVTVMTVVVLFYIALTGFSASVLRAGLMLIITSLLFLVSRKADAITALTISVTIIAVLNPTAVFDTSLWLSAFATLGVVVYSEIAEKVEKDASLLQKGLTGLKNGIFVSFFAFAATFALTALRFDAFSIVSVFTTLLFSFVIQFLIYGGLLLLLIGGIIPFGKLLVLLSNLVFNIAESISSLKFVYVSMDFTVVKILIAALTVFFFAFLILDFKNKKRGIAILMILMVSVFTVAGINTLKVRHEDCITYSPDTAGDMTILKSNGEVTAIYSGKAFADNGWSIIDTFSLDKLTYVDNFIFTSYSYSTLDFISILIAAVKVENIALPPPNTADEVGQIEGLSYLLEGYGTDMTFYNSEEYIPFGNYQYRLVERVDYTYGEYPENVYEVIFGDERFTYLSVCEYDLLSPSAKALLYNSHNLIIGSIGNAKYYIFDMHLPDVEKIYYFDEGRIAEETLDFYKEKGASTRCIKTPINILN